MGKVAFTHIAFKPFAIDQIIQALLDLQFPTPSALNFWEVLLTLHLTEEVPAVDAEEEDKVINNLDNEKECCRP